MSPSAHTIRLERNRRRAHCTSTSDTQMPEAIHQLLILFDDLSVLVPPIEPVLRKEVRQCSEYLQATRTHSLPSFRNSALLGVGGGLELEPQLLIQLQQPPAVSMTPAVGHYLDYTRNPHATT